MVCVMALHSARLRMWTQTILSSHSAGALTGLDLFCWPALCVTLAVGFFTPARAFCSGSIQVHFCSTLISFFSFFLCFGRKTHPAGMNQCQGFLERRVPTSGTPPLPPRHPYAPSELRTRLTSELESNPTETCDITLAAFATFCPLNFSSVCLDTFWGFFGPHPRRRLYFSLTGFQGEQRSKRQDKRALIWYGNRHD